jgi:hypothetical protein
MTYNFFDYVDKDTIHLKDFVIATTLIRKSETWKKKDNMFSICGLDILNDKLFCLILSDLDECINASRYIYKELHEHENIAVTVLDAEELDVTNLLHDSEINIVNDTNEFVSSYIHDYLGGG